MSNIKKECYILLGIMLSFVGLLLYLALSVDNVVLEKEREASIQKTYLDCVKNKNKESCVNIITGYKVFSLPQQEEAKQVLLNLNK